MHDCKIKSELQNYYINWNKLSGMQWMAINESAEDDDNDACAQIKWW